MRPYVILSPHWAHNSGGIRELHHLCHQLNSRDVPAYILAVDGSGLTSPYLPGARCISPKELPLIGDYIGVYPEIFHGNPLKARTVVRWLLAPPGSIAGPTSFPETDLLFWYNTKAYNGGQGEELYMLFTEPEFNNQNLPPKRHACLWIGKGAPYVPAGFTWTGVHITYAWPSTRQALAQLLRESKVLVTFDFSTGMFHEAAYCGTPTLYVGPPERFTTYWGRDGIAFKEDELEWAQATVPRIWDRRRAIEANTQKQLTRFVELTQAH